MVGATEFEQRPEVGVLAEELLTALPSMLQEHLDQE